MTTQTIKQYVLDNFDKNEIKEITVHGMASGFGNLIYYSETCAFHDEHENEIWEMLYEEAKDQEMTIIELIAKFNGQKNVGDLAQFKNLLCWYAVEHVCNEIINESEEN